MLSLGIWTPGHIVRCQVSSASSLRVCRVTGVETRTPGHTLGCQVGRVRLSMQQVSAYSGPITAFKLWFQLSRGVNFAFNLSLPGKQRYASGVTAAVSVAHAEDEHQRDGRRGQPGQGQGPHPGPYASSLSQLNFSSCVRVTTQLIPLIYSEMAGRYTSPYSHLSST